LLALGLVTLATYGCGLMLSGTGLRRLRLIVMWSGIAAALLVLIWLKYLPFLTANVNSLILAPLGHSSLPVTKALLSIGVSYYIFQAISYLADIYQGKTGAERHLGYFSLYLCFFPKLLQGPLERAGDLIPQLRAPYRFNYDMARSGLLLFMWGMFQKLVVADRLALFVDPVYGNVRDCTGMTLLLATYIYAVQLLCDFGGYTDMALGIARMFGITLTQNFNAPYVATSIADFWRRWHISFSRWVLDYIFRPLQLPWVMRGKVGTALALVITFLISGVWHGASWGFVIWGGLHGVYLATPIFWKPYQKRIHTFLGLEKSRLLKVWQIVVVFNLVCFSFVFFRSDSLADAWQVVTRIAGIPLEIFTQGGALLGLHRTRFLQTILVTVLVAAVALFRERIRFYTRPLWFRWGVYFGLVYGTLYFSVLNTKGAFIYFQF
jgi:D-alanyl-lipoteichoic acid acyltransferase DltB (MBOAT superfamily)